MPATPTSARVDDDFTSQLRGFGVVGLLAVAAILAVGTLGPGMGGLAVLGWAYASRTPWRDLGFVRPKSWALTLAGGIVLGAALKLVLKALVMPLLGAPDINPRYHYLAGNAAAIPFTMYAVIFGAGFGEEMFFRAFLFERLGKLFAPGRLTSRIAIVLFSSALFAAAHYADQGIPGVEQAAIVGLVLATIFAATGSIVLPMIVHAAFDVAAVAIIYWDVESQVAHLLFR